MSRTLESQKWFLPLHSGTELANRAPALIQTDPSDVVGEVPVVCQPAGLLLWLDSALAPAGRLSQWIDRSASGNHATQPITSLQPLATAGGVDFKD